MPTVLFHIEDKAKAKQISELCRALKFSQKSLTQADSGKTVGALCGTSGASKQISKIPEGFKLPDLLIFDGMGENALDVFLSAYRTAEIQPAALKAVVTRNNLGWPLYSLAAELQREHAAMLLSRYKK